MTVPQYISADEAMIRDGLRIAFSQGVPGPWGVAVRAIFEVKGIDYIPVAQVPGDPNDALRRWTGQNSAPVAVLNSERPRSHWSEQLLLAERLAPEPPLIPKDQNDRTRMWGLCHELAGEEGLGWTLRSIIFADPELGPPAESSMRFKFASATPDEELRARLNTIIDMFASIYNQQKSSGSRYFIGNSLTAVDIYWAAFSVLLVPMERDVCVMPDYYRAFGPANCRHLDRPLDRSLLSHRDYILEKYVRLPLEF